MSKLIDETGHTYGRLTVLYRIPNTTPAKWHCKCQCGNECDVVGTALRSGNTKSCGCLQKDRAIESNIRRGKTVKIGDKFGSLTVLEIKPKRLICQCDCGTIKEYDKGHVVSGHTSTCGCHINLQNPQYINEVGNTYGWLTVIEDAGRTLDGKTLWRCQCICGNEKIALGKSLRAGLVKSCGCMHSKGEAKIATLLDNLQIKYERQKAFNDLLSNNGWHLYFDFYLPIYNIVIEYQGEQHYSYNNRGWNNLDNFEKTQSRDAAKRDYCKLNNIRLIEIPYLDFNKLNEEYLREVINNGDSRN